MRTLLLLATAVLAFAARPAAASDFMDVRLTWTLSEDNFLADPGETANNSPGLGIGPGPRVFFDNYETKYTGFETMGHLVLTKRMPALVDDFGAEASLFLSMMVDGTRQVGFRDEGSFIRMFYDLSGGISDDSNLELVLFPITGDRFRMGYSYRISWGGDDFFPDNYGLVPAGKLQLNLPWGYAFFGFKTTQIRENIGNSEQTEMVTNHGLLAGLGVDVEGFVVEAKGAYFTRGTLQPQALRGRGLYASGLSYQVGYHDGMDIGRSIDFELYLNDPEMEFAFFAPERYEGGLSLRIMHEGNVLWQTLQNPEQPTRTTDQLAWAFDLNVAVKWDYLRIHFDALVQSLSYLLQDVPSFTPFQDFPDSVDTSPAFWAALGFDYHFDPLALTTGLKGGVYKPATYTIDDLDVGGAMFSGRRTVVIRGPAQRDILPMDYDVRLIYSIKASLRWDYAEMLSVIAELYYSFDDNQVVYTSDFYGLNVFSEFVDPHVLGLNLMAQARF